MLNVAASRVACEQTGIVQDERRGALRGGAADKHDGAADDVRVHENRKGITRVDARRTVRTALSASQPDAWRVAAQEAPSAVFILDLERLRTAAAGSGDSGHWAESCRRPRSARAAFLRSALLGGQTRQPGQKTGRLAGRLAGWRSTSALTLTATRRAMR
jgi:hypothetical protein